MIVVDKPLQQHMYYRLGPRAPLVLGALGAAQQRAPVAPPTQSMAVETQPGVYYFPEAKVDRPGLVVVMSSPSAKGDSNGRMRIRDVVVPAAVSGVTTFISMMAFTLLASWWEKNKGIPLKKGFK